MANVLLVNYLFEKIILIKIYNIYKYLLYENKKIINDIYDHKYILYK